MDTLDDSNRVTIPRKPGQERSDYINASFIDGFKEKRAYIATQGPLSDTIDDLWSMIWHYQVKTIVMLTNTMERGQEASSEYWPEKVNESTEYGRVSVTQNECRDDNDVVDYTVRQFNLTHSDFPDDDRTVHQYHYLGWPEVGQPTELEGLSEIIAQTNSENDPPRPIVVHCSAGGGRTGIFCALSIMINRCECEGLIDVFQTVKKLRDQRPHIIQTKEQLSFCYTAMLEYLKNAEMADNSTLTSDLDSDGNLKMNGDLASPGSRKLLDGNGYVNMAMEDDISGSMNNQLDLDSSQDNQSQNTAENFKQEEDVLPPPSPEPEDKRTDTEESGSEFEIVVNKNDIVV